MQITPARYRTIAIGALVALSVIIITGASVRLTNSGLGCDDWPNCNSQRLIDVSSKHAAIEQVNRLFTGIVGVAVIAAVLGSLWRVPRRSDLTWLSVWLVVGVVANAVLGGISVMVDLHPIAVQGHMLLSMMLITAGSILVRRSGEPDGVPRRRTVSKPTERLVWLHFVVVTIAIVTGTVVTGAGPHAGDENAERLDIAIPTAARLHAVTVLTAIAIALLIAWRLRTVATDRQALMTPLSRWIGIGLTQAALGYIQYFSDVPELLVGIHVLGATLVMIATTFLVLDTRRAVSPDDEIRRADGVPSQPAVV
ncbi:MAG: COX15/CtaA family protein [Ilumatobacter fluminis]|uniref:COX15/CtaA family protein n=1 Tax=Ilumatobacter fluminis TaxID=467091 RepID=UPI0032EE08E3